MIEIGIEIYSCLRSGNCKDKVMQENRPCGDAG